MLTLRCSVRMTGPDAHETRFRKGDIFGWEPLSRVVRQYLRINIVKSPLCLLRYLDWYKPSCSSRFVGEKTSVTGMSDSVHPGGGIFPAFADIATFEH